MQLLPREKQRHAYLNAVKERYKHLPEISRIDRFNQSTSWQTHKLSEVGFFAGSAIWVSMCLRLQLEPLLGNSRFDVLAGAGVQASALA